MPHPGVTQRRLGAGLTMWLLMVGIVAVLAIWLH